MRTISATLCESWETGTAVPSEFARRSLPQAVLATAEARPERIAVIDRDGTRHTAYADLRTLCLRWAGRLAAAGVSAGTPVGLSVDRDLSAVVGILAILAAGGAVVPLDPTLPPERRRAMAAAIGCRTILAPDGPQPFTADHDPGNEPEPNIRHPPEQVAVIYHTSGSTGRPKPVALPHAALSARLFSMADWFGIDEDEVVGAGSSYAFDPFLQQMFLPLISGGAVWIPDPLALLDPVRFRREAETVGLTHFNLVPSQIAGLLRGFPEAPLPSLRRVVLGGERMAPDLPERIVRALGPCAVYNMYGPTEATVDATGERVALPVTTDSVSIGSPLPGCRVRILDADLNRVPPGEPGELCIGGVGLALGYLGLPEATAASFIPDPFGEPGERLYRTGDIATFLPDGRIEFIGRRDEQVKIRGRRLELGEVEAAIATFPDVSGVAVKLWAGAPGGAALVAHVTGIGADREAALRAHLAEHLTEAAIPARILFPRALPVSTSGKIDKTALPDPEPDTPPRPVTATDTPTLERTIADVWARLLRRDTIDAATNLFEMGAHSLLIPQALEAIRAATGLCPSAVDLFRYPTVAALARALTGDTAPPAARRPTAPARGPIAIVGVAARLPGADGLAAYERLLYSGQTAVRRYDRETLLGLNAPADLIDHPDFVPVHGAVDGLDRFDPMPFGLTAGEAMEIDPQHRLLLELAQDALDDAACDGERDGPVGVFAGIGFNAYLVDNLKDRLGFAGGFERYSVVVAADKDFAATRIAYKLGLTGPALTVATACSTALTAVVSAIDALRAGRCRVALAGAASLGMFSRFGHIASEGGIASPTGTCRPFDAEADGITAGQGGGVVALKRLEDAEADGDRILGVILGAGITNDGGGKAAFTAPTVDGQAAAIAQALADAGIDHAEIGFVEGHGTGTALGDPIEVTALNSVYTGLKPGAIPLGSVKGAIGHLDAAAGIAGLLAALIAVRRGEIPPTTGFRTPNPRIPFAEGPFRVSGAVEPWPGDAGRRRIAGISAFGMGGTNIHLILAEPPPRPTEGGTTDHPALLTVSAATATAADALAAAIPPPLADTAAALARRRVFGHRRAAVAGPTVTWLSGEAAKTAPFVAFSFPGQGAQRPGMARDLYDAFPPYRAVIDDAHARLSGGPAAGLRALLLAAPDDAAAAKALTRTEMTQPALFVTECASAILLHAFGIRPSALIGHSIGEYVAAHLAGVMSFDDALRLVAARGRLMGEAAPGAMLALSLPEADAVPLIVQAGADLAAINGPRQCVAAGSEAVIATLEREAARLDLPARRLPVSHAFHSALMDPVLPDFAREFERVTLRPPALPVISNLTGAVLTAEDATDPAYWTRHLRGTVRLVDGLKALKALSAETVIVEAGPGTTLTRSARAAGFAESQALAIDPDPAGDARIGVLTVLARLWTGGVEIDRRAAAGRSSRRIAAPPYPYERVRLWIEPSQTLSAPPPPRAVSRPEDDHRDGPAGSPVLAAVLAEWRDVLGAPSLGPDDDFFESGGDSLLAIRLVARLRRLGRDTTTAELFAARTPSGLAGLFDTMPAVQPAADREEGWL